MGININKSKVMTLMILILILFGGCKIFDHYFGKYFTHSDEDISHLSKYQNMVNKKFETLLDLYVYEYGDGSGITLEVPGDQTISINQIKGDLPYDDEGDYVLEIVPGNSVFTVNRIVLKDRGIGGKHIGIYIKFDNEVLYRGEVDAVFLSDYSKDKTAMNSKYVTEVISDEGVKNEKE
jgi:hypothetical protein